MAFELPNLTYSIDSLEPVISRRTLEFHYGKHHQAYVNNINNLVKGTNFEDATLEKIIKEADGAIFNNGAQVWNHTFYFNSFSPKGGGEPSGKLLEMINSSFSSFYDFKEKFTKSALSVFGSGWTWLVIDNNNKLKIVEESNAGNPMRSGLLPILTFDVWEHAYYLDYQNRRNDYISALWNIIDWNVVTARIFYKI
jgi:Fe-Mn family superoxide dismutase